MKALLQLLFKVGYLHEIFHYLAARAFGLPARIYSTYVTYLPPRENWKLILIVLAPSLVAFPLVILTFIFWTKDITNRRNALWFLISLTWFLTSWYDLGEFIHFLTTGQWPEKDGP